MLSDRHLELLTAFVDGELTRRQRKSVLRLLYQSSEARSVLQDFQENAHRLLELPRRKLGDDFAPQVLKMIADRGLQPALEPRPVIRRLQPRWLAYAAAVCLVLAAGLGIYFANRSSPDADALVVKKVNDLPKVLPESAPLRVAFSELAQQPTREMLAKRLERETAVHLDVTVRDRASAVKRLQDVLAGQGIKTIVEPRAQAKLKKGGQGKAEYLVYAENIQADELETMLRQLADVPRKAGWAADDGAGQANLKSAFESMVVTSLSVQDRNHLSSLGVDASEPGVRRKSPGEVRSFIEDAPKDKNPRVGFPAPKYERFAMVLANDGDQSALSSDEMKMFLARRQQQRPGTVQVLFVIRQA
jgi:hypothetical protein